jgi:hypothetical protein
MKRLRVGDGRKLFTLMTLSEQRGYGKKPPERKANMKSSIDCADMMVYIAISWPAASLCSKKTETLENGLALAST